MRVVLAFLSDLGPGEIVVILVVAVLIFGKNLPQAASKAYLQVRKLRTAIDDLRRDTGIDRELRNIERTVREAEWEARKPVAQPSAPILPHRALPTPGPSATAAEPGQTPAQAETPVEPELSEPGAASPDDASPGSPST